VDGHDENAIDTAIRALLVGSESQPKALVAHTVKGKGVSFMEDDNRWHYTRLNEATFQASIHELVCR
jgi:transketolase